MLLASCSFPIDSEGLLNPKAQSLTTKKLVSIFLREVADKSSHPSYRLGKIFACYFSKRVKERKGNREEKDDFKRVETISILTATKILELQNQLKVVEYSAY